MAKLSHTDSRRMYSWWWDSHISPKNSKWLQENLTDMDMKVKSMIKLIEEDADSFARRAEMYYKKRPELMKMVEEFYRAYRALVERYNHATGVIRHAHRTMSEAFPNQVPVMFGDDSFDAKMPEVSTLIGEYAVESDSCPENTSLKQFNDHIRSVERIRKGLNFDEAEEKELINGNSHSNDKKSPNFEKEKMNEEILALKEALSRVEAEKEAGLIQYQHSLDKLSQLETEISKTREDFEELSNHAREAEDEVAFLTEKITTLESEKESKLQEYQKSIEKLNVTANTAEIEAQSVKREPGELHTEKDASLDQKSIEERSRFVEAETAFLTLQHLHEQTQEELRAMASEVQRRAQLLKVAETINRDLQDEVVKVKGENKHLEEPNEASASLIKEMQSEISSLMESKGKLEEEAELRLDHTNSLQQEICCLKEELKDLNGKHFSVLDQVHAVGLSAESLGPSVSELQDENHRLKETYQRESGEKMALLEKLAVFEQLLEKNSLLEASISDLNGELEAVRGKLQELEKTCELLSEEKSSLLEEKAALVSQLQEKNKNLEILSKNNTVLENFLSNVHRMLEALKDKSKVLEDSCQFLLDEKAGLMNERDGLASQLENTRAELDGLRKLYTELKVRCTNLEKENESTLRKADELNMSLEVEIRENASYIQKIEQDNLHIKQLFDKLHTLKKSLCKSEEENLGSSIELLVLVAWVRQLILGSQNLEAARNTIEHERKTLSSRVEELNVKLADMQREKSVLSQEKMSLIDNIQHLEGKNIFLEEENHLLCGKLFALENLPLIFKIFVEEKSVVFREIGDDRNKLRNMNAGLIEKLEASKAKNRNLKETLKKTKGELKLVVTDRDQLRVETENAEATINRVEKQKRELNESVENLKMDCYVAKMARGHQENHILKLAADNELVRKEKKLLAEANQKLESDLQKLREEHDLMKTREESLRIELQKKMAEMNEMENKATFFLGHYQCSMVSQLLYEQKFKELHDVCLGYRDQNEKLEARLAAYGPEILSLKECILSLENQTHIHIKFPNPKNEDLQGVNNSNESRLTSGGAANLHHLTARLRAITKVASELKDLLLQEKADLHSKLQHTTKQLESLQSDNGPHRRHRRRPASEITKDIILDQASDGSSVGPSKRNSPLTMDPCNQMVELWETSDPDGSVGLTVSRSKKITETVECRRLKSIKKQKSPFLSSEVSRTPNVRRVQERLDSDVQKLSNLQITVHDLKRKLEATEKGKRGKAAVECEALKGQLEEAGSAVARLFELNGRLMKSIDKGSFTPAKSVPFDLENEGSVRRRKAAEQARRMSERIGRVQLEVQRLQFVLMKMDEVKNRAWEGRRRVLLRDYLYGRTGQGQKRKNTQFCTCVQASAVDE